MMGIALKTESIKGAPAVLGRTLVQPRDMTKVVVGVYQQGTPPPEVQAKVSPAHASDAIAVSVAQITSKGGSYKLICNIMNFGDKPCDIQLTKHLATV